ncbi:MAG: polysaccharide deacetylase family protein [Rhodospirillaceae bacterium]|mgnify:FL=1|jgi:allantoinase|nr:polysaccharide deacetylase family protein [Rhodospirillaceae bacterium]MBT5940104.1 polysaccharide deacetylase family protein [Rhodospirillaceae bacterium]MBT7268499.1 polysaccharide deacetylase family protein [Rhodospirillaceae bacterium]
MKIKERIDYSAIVDRKPLSLPDGGRVIVWPVVNLEEWPPELPLPRRILTPPGEGGHVPDIPNWCWSEYGMRIGVWRLMKVLEEFGITPTVSMNGTVPEAYPRVAEAALEAGWEFMGHSYIQKPMYDVDDEREAIFKTMDVMQKYCGYKPRGWMGPGLTQTENTPELLVEAGFEYTADWILDDQPCPINTKGDGQLYSIPYTTELNDIPIMLSQHHVSSILYDRTMDYFDTLYEEGAENVRIMTIAVHPYIHGVPHRIKYFRKIFKELSEKPGVVFMTGAEILDWYLAQQ